MPRFAGNEGPAGNKFLKDDSDTEEFNNPTQEVCHRPQ
jgi:hypothetical protein